MTVYVAMVRRDEDTYYLGQPGRGLVTLDSPRVFAWAHHDHASLFREFAIIVLGVRGVLVVPVEVKNLHPGLEIR